MNPLIFLVNSFSEAYVFDTYTEAEKYFNQKNLKDQKVFVRCKLMKDVTKSRKLYNFHWKCSSPIAKKNKKILEELGHNVQA